MIYRLDVNKEAIKLFSLFFAILFLLCSCSLFKKKTPTFDCKIFRPVCGVDEATYYNQCQAEDYKADVAYDGACNGSLIKTIPYEIK